MDMLSCGMTMSEKRMNVGRMGSKRIVDGEEMEGGRMLGVMKE